jgi:uncharacterized protein (DUF1015 family)
MADVRPFRALRYNLDVVGSLDEVAAPPYDVIDDALRAELAARSPFNVVEVDLPRSDGGDPYLHAETTFESWRQEGVVVRDREPALFAMSQEYETPGGGSVTRTGFFARVRIERYGAGRIRPHERTQPGPRADRLALQRATRANLSPVFSLYDDEGDAVQLPADGEPDATYTDADGTISRLWRVADEDALTAATEAMADRELLIADGHHRYETALAYADEVGGEGEHRYVLMYLCSLSDPGLTVFPTHRLLTTLDEGGQAALAEAIERDFEVEEVDASDLQPDSGTHAIEFGFVGSSDGRPRRLRLRDEAVVDRALAEAPAAYRRVDAAVLEAVVLHGSLGMTSDDIADRRGLDYERDASAAVRAVERGAAGAAFILAPTPIDLVREVAAAGEPMPPKSTYFYPKVPTGLLFNLLE